MPTPSVTLDPETQTLYTANEVDDSVSVIDPTRCDAQTTSGCRARVPEDPTTRGGLAADLNAATIYVASGSNTVSMIGAATCNAYRPTGCDAATPTVTVGTNPTAVAVNPATHTVYVGNHAPFAPGSTGTISVIDDRTCIAHDQMGCATVSTIQVPDGNPVALAVNPRTDTIYVATITSTGGTNLISVFNGGSCNATNTTDCNHAPANAPTGDDGGGNSTEVVAVNPTTNTIYAASDVTLNGAPYTGDTVYMIAGPTCDAADTSGCSNPPATISLPTDPVFGEANPFAIVVDQATDTVYTANIADGEGPGTISIINAATCNSHSTSGCDQTPATAPAGFGASDLAVDPITNQVYSTNIQDASVTTVNGNTCIVNTNEGGRTRFGRWQSC